MDPDLPLLRALQGGDEAALNELIRRHQAPLLRFVGRCGLDETTAREVVQETFVRAYFKAGGFRPRAAVKTWLYAIALNLARDQFRRWRRRGREVPLDAPAAPELPEEGAGPAERAAEQDRWAELRGALARLPRRLHDALVLCALEEQSHKEAAAVLGTTPKSVELRVARAKRRLRGLLGGA